MWKGILLAGSLIVVGCTEHTVPIEPEPEVPGVKIGAYQSHMQIGTGQQLDVTVTGITNTALFFGYRADEVPARPDPNAHYIVRLETNTGRFTANSVGTVVIVARSQARGGLIDTAVITVDPPPIDRRIRFKSLATDDGRTCGLTLSGETYCWGANRSGGLGAPATSMCGFGRRETDFPCNPLPAKVSTPVAFETIVAGPEHTCGLTSAGALYCWGRNNWGEVGNGTSTPVTSPSQVAVPGKVTMVSAGVGRTCAVNDAHLLYCWGIISGTVFLDAFGGPGCFSTGRCTSIPMPVDGLVNVARISVGHGHTCAIETDGAAYCWGPNFFGQLGIGSYLDTNTPLRVQTSVIFSDITAGSTNTCALTPVGEAYCWGMTGSPITSCDNSPTTCSVSPRAVDTPLRFKELVAKANGVCGLTPANEMYCWGIKYLIGISEFSDVLVPTRILEDKSVTSISNGYRTCAVTSTGLAYCWSRSNGAGEEGNGTLTSSFNSSLTLTPTIVEGPPQ